MKIQVLGVRGFIKPSAPRYSNHSGVLIDDVLMLDCGEEKFLSHRPKYLLISHLHSDHAFFVEHKNAIVHLPKLTFAPEPMPSMGIRQLTERIELKPYLITPLPTIHSNNVASQGYLIETKHKRIIYTGDLVGVEGNWLNTIGRVDLLITEASFLRKGGLVRKYKDGSRSGHAGITEIIELFRHLTDRILFIHFGSWFYRDINAAKQTLKHMGTTYGITVEIGYDGLSFGI